MTVAQNQIAELYSTLLAYTQPALVGEFLKKLTEGQAYRRNRSFRTTVDRLRDYHLEHRFQELKRP